MLSLGCLLNCVSGREGEQGWGTSALRCLPAPFFSPPGRLLASELAWWWGGAALLVGSPGGGMWETLGLTVPKNSGPRLTTGRWWLFLLVPSYFLIGAHWKGGALKESEGQPLW